MKLKYLGKGNFESKEDTAKITEALSQKGFVVHHRPDYPRQITIFEELEE